MVRTRRVQAKKGNDSAVEKKPGEDVSMVSSSNKDEKDEDHWKTWLMDFNREIKNRMCRLEEKVQEEIDALQRAFQVQLSLIPAKELNQPPSTQSYDSLAEFLAPSNESLSSIGSLSTMRKTKKCIVTSTAVKPGPSSPPKTTQRQSRARVRRTRTSSLSDADFALGMPAARRVTRSSSQNRDARLLGTLTKYQTPSMNRPAPTCVTPKVDLSIPLPLKRHPRQGEVAISLTGSPLMMTMSITEPNISLPMSNGQVYSIMPTEGPCPSFPDLDSPTRQKLLILKQNLNKILGDH